MPGPLDGIRVIDLTTVVSGPLSTMILGDQGADVIKVESPHGGDYSRDVATRRGGFSASFINNNRNKRSIVLDLKSDAGLTALLRLVREADVFVQNFRPGVAERLGLGEVALRQLNERLIYVSIAGFGFEGPMANMPAYDPLIQAFSALASVQAGSDEQRPRLLRTILPDKLTGIQASQAIVAALFARERNGIGQHVQLSMLDTIVAFLWSSDMGSHTFKGNEVPVEEAQSFFDLIYEVTDGFVSVSIMQDKHWIGFATAMERPDLLEREMFSTPELRDINRDARFAATQEALHTYSSGDVLLRLNRAGVPCSPVLTRTEMLAHPQVGMNASVFESEHPQAGRIRQARHPAVFSKTPTSLRHYAPVLGEHTRDVLLESGLDTGAIEAAVSSKNAAA